MLNVIWLDNKLITFLKRSIRKPPLETNSRYVQNGRIQVAEIMKVKYVNNRLKQEAKVFSRNEDKLTATAMSKESMCSLFCLFKNKSVNK
jgi:hypothetical protein